MRTEIPTTLGVITLSFAAMGCAQTAVAEAFEKVCKADCECSESEDIWNEEKNCKKACVGQAKQIAADLADREEDPCDDIKKIAKDLKKCAKESCGDDRNECVSEAAQDLYECWPPDDSYYYDNAEEQEDALDVERELTSREIMDRMLYQASYSEEVAAAD